jgi:MYXO-CTERM domain-containing protein
VCDLLDGSGALLRVHAEAAEDGALRGVVDEVFGPVPGYAGIRVGDRVSGAIDVEKPCAAQEHLPTLASAELLVLFIPGSDGGYPNCGVFLACAERSCSGLSEPALSDCWNDCDGETAAACSDSRSAALLNGNFRFAVPWEAELDFGAERRLPSADVSVLLSPETCLERFPYGATPPCNDTVSTTSCGVTEASPTARGHTWLAAALGLALLGWSRRGRSSASRARRNPAP